MNARTLPYIAGPREQTIRERRHGPGLLFARVLASFKVWHERNRQHETLARLDDRLLDDAGLQRDDVMQAAREPFWRL